MNSLLPPFLSLGGSKADMAKVTFPEEADLVTKLRRSTSLDGLDSFLSSIFWNFITAYPQSIDFHLNSCTEYVYKIDTKRNAILPAWANSRPEEADRSRLIRSQVNDRNNKTSLDEADCKVGSNQWMILS